MGGKGQRRREKNYRAVHGGGTSLPPPPKSSDLDAIPSKLRKIMQLRGPPPNPNLGGKDSGKIMGKDVKKAGKSGKGISATSPHVISEGQKEHRVIAAEAVEDDNERLGITVADDDNKRKRKRKRKTLDDLQLQKLNMVVAGTKRREKRKKYLEEKKNKHKKAKIVEVIDFPGREQIKFGEVVEAPPKLTFPKATKNVQDAFRERLRLQAVEAYRKRKGWTSRPGIQVPPVLT